MTAVGPDINIDGKGPAVILALNAVSITIVIARCMTQRFIIRQLGLSDALVVVSMCTISSMAALIAVQYHYGWGRHYAYLDPFHRIEAMKYSAIGQSSGVMGSTFGLMSFIILMLQLFGTSKLKHAALWTLFWVEFIPNCIVVITLYVQCNDIQALWDTSNVSSCWPESYQTYIGYAHTSWNGHTDFLLTCLPATMLWSLQMNRRTKFGLVFLLSLSLLAFVGVIMKIVYIRVLADRGDYAYNIVPFFVRGEKERVLEPWVVKKEVGYSVRVEETAEKDMEKVKPKRERGRNHTFMVPKRASKGSMSILSHVSMV
ncbi:uncharacterized protein EAF01_006498 [Botrytis porri]|uniref:uncharacterized protein n=1 Tax=Botrytis porri TaxID=87229 RepID=UPI0018FF2A41|nr:uncharacterized protein EAF01_006498 [Botrytis porri]KAF7903449.1 hypothetical protein EAF01_006498 [Botrytis porri]